MLQQHYLVTKKKKTDYLCVKKMLTKELLPLKAALTVCSVEVS